MLVFGTYGDFGMEFVDQTVRELWTFLHKRGLDGPSDFVPYKNASWQIFLREIQLNVVVFLKARCCFDIEVIHALS